MVSEPFIELEVLIDIVKHHQVHCTGSIECGVDIPILRSIAVRLRAMVWSGEYETARNMINQIQWTHYPVITISKEKQDEAN